MSQGYIGWILIALPIVAGIIYLLFSPVVARSFYRKYLFRPTKYPEGSYEVEWINHIKRQEYFFPSTNGVKLHAWYFEVPKSNWVILVSHGNGKNLTSRIPLIGELIAAGASVFIYDYRGYGRSIGVPTIRGVCDDGQAAFEFLTNELHVSHQKIVLYGESLGTGISCYLSQKISCAGMILQSGFTSLWSVGREKLPHLKLYPDFMLPNPHLDNLAAIKRKHPPILFVHGDQDTVVSISDTEELFRHANEPKMFARLTDIAHSNVVESDEFLKAVKEFLASLG